MRRKHPARVRRGSVRAFAERNFLKLKRLPLHTKIAAGVVAALCAALVVAAVALFSPAPQSVNPAADIPAILLDDPLYTGPSVLQFDAEPTPMPTPDAPAEPTPDPTLKKGMEGEEVQRLQERLMELNYLDIDESTQYFGSATRDALTRFQRQHDLLQDGVAGPMTLEILYSADAKKYVLLEGTRGTDVDMFQAQLVDLGYLKHSTGYYGTETVAAVKAFQERNKLTVDGKAGEQTLEMIYSDSAKPSEDKAREERRKANISTMIATAQKMIGRPYVLGATGPKSFDCSGLVYYCLKQAGSNRTRLNAQGYSNVSDWTKITSMSKLQKGDLLFFWNSGKTKVGHVGIYIGGGMMIDASSSNDRVMKRSCTTAYWKKMFVCARRPW